MVIVGWTSTMPSRSPRGMHRWTLAPPGVRPPLRAGGADMINVLDGMLGYSYQGQDLFVVDALGGQVGGYFLDSGASNGCNGSNTWLLESQYGWSGVCVEPNAQAFRQLTANRACVCLDCCLYDRDGPVDFLEAAGVYGGIIQEYDP